MYRYFLARQVVTACCVFAYLWGGNVAAQTYEVVQKDIKFVPSVKVIKAKDTITFANKDSVIHNIVSLAEGFEFDLGEVRPGDRKTVKFDREGEITVECTIHPTMRMTVFVSP